VRFAPGGVNRHQRAPRKGGAILVLFLPPLADVRSISADDVADVLLLTDHICSVGTVVLAKLAAVFEADQVGGRRKQRNDRLIGVPVEVVSRQPMLPAITLHTALRKSSPDFSSNTTNFKAESSALYVMPTPPKLSVWCGWRTPNG
jgi:hypothetical protein